MPSLSDLLDNNNTNKTIIEKPKDNILKISQSIIKKLYDKHQEPIMHCPLELYECDIKHNFDTTTTAMLNGLFGEGLLLGKSAKGQLVTELPKHKKTGVTLTAEVNIRQQAELAKKILLKHQINIIKEYNTQVPVVCKIEDNVYLQTELDIFPTTIFYKGGVKLACVDIKFSQDINSSYGPYSWQKFEYMDHIQPDSIFYLLDNIDVELCKAWNPEFELRVGYDNVFSPIVLDNLYKLKFIYFVIGYKNVNINDIQLFERLKYEVVNGNESKTRQIEFKERMRKAIEVLKTYYNRGFIAIPYNDINNNKGCSKCRVNKINGGYCDKGGEFISF